MSNSIVFYHGRDDSLYIVDPDCLPNFDDAPPLLCIAAAIIHAGYVGVIIDEKKLLNGRFIHCLSTNFATPEGRIFAGLAEALSDGKTVPSSAAVLESIQREYHRYGVQS
jgi:hypothetical protein